MNAYEKLRIAIIIQLKTDYFKGCISKEKLYRELQSEWIMYLLGDIHPDEAYKALVERKERYEHFQKNRELFPQTYRNSSKGNETKILHSDIPERKKSDRNTGSGCFGVHQSGDN